ncbi:MAG: universal stress protein [Oxalobacter sp.]|nr:MAG: universal stress protein [Oxalobacter sp.]
MFTKILIPTDGSTVGTLSALEGVAMAEKHGAEVVGVFVARELQNPAFDFSDLRPKNFPTREEYGESVIAAGQTIMKPLEDAAKNLGIKFSSITKISNATARTIVETAKETNCTLIFMGSHGCAGWGHNLLGSVATKVLATTQIPTLIYRLKKEPGPEAEKVIGFKPKLGA